MNNTTLQDAIGQRGEALFYVLITKLYGRSRPIFKPQFLGDKWPTVDFIVELVNYAGHITPYFFAQVKTTRQGYTMTGKRLKVRVSTADARKLASLPAPTYVIGIDEINELAYIASANEPHQKGLTSLSTNFPINPQTQDALYREVENFWKRHSKSHMASKFADPNWR